MDYKRYLRKHYPMAIKKKYGQIWILSKNEQITITGDPTTQSATITNLWAATPFWDEKDDIDERFKICDDEPWVIDPR